MNPLFVAAVACVVVAAAAAGVASVSDKTKQKAWAGNAAVIFFLAFFGLMLGAANQVGREKDARREAAVNTLEERYDITIDSPGYVDSMAKADWMIDKVWRECYLTDDDITKIETTTLMCDTAGDTYAEYGTVTDVPAANMS